MVTGMSGLRVILQVPACAAVAARTVPASSTQAVSARPYSLTLPNQGSLWTPGSRRLNRTRGMFAGRLS
jgi:hypothetical protein